MLARPNMALTVLHGHPGTEKRILLACCRHANGSIRLLANYQVVASRSAARPAIDWYGATQSREQKVNRVSIVNTTLITPFRRIPEGSLSWDQHGRIRSVAERDEAAGIRLDAGGMLLCPGFINLHVHGGLGADTLDGSLLALQKISGHQARQGVTGYLATTASASGERIAAAARAMKDFPRGRRSPDQQAGSRPAVPPAAGKTFERGGAQILGLHLEGPYLSPQQAGAQNPLHFRDPDWSQFSAWQAASGGSIRLIALAPERDPDGRFIRRAVDSGVIVAAGHTNATYEQARRAIDAGLSHATHFFNAMSRFNYREPGVLEALLEDEHISLELIPDCSAVPHVHPTAIRLLHRIAGVERLCTVTDAISVSGMPDGAYRWAGMPVVKGQGMVFLADEAADQRDRRLAGSVLDMHAAVRNLVEQAGLSLTEAVETATTNPARKLGLQDHKGRLETGWDADLVLLHPDTFEVLATFVCGELVFQSTHFRWGSDLQRD